MTIDLDKIIAEVKPSLKIVRNSSGQVVFENPNGNYFDPSIHINDYFITLSQARALAERVMRECEMMYNESSVGGDRAS